MADSFETAGIPDHRRDYSGDASTSTRTSASSASHLLRVLSRPQLLWPQLLEVWTRSFATRSLLTSFPRSEGLILAKDRV